MRSAITRREPGCRSAPRPSPIRWLSACATTAGGCRRNWPPRRSSPPAGRAARAPEPAWACPSRRASCRRTAARSSSPRSPRAPASGWPCRSRLSSSTRAGPPGRTRSEASKLPRMSEVHEMTAMAEGARKTCALVVEDDPNIVDLIRSNLAVRGFDTVVSVDGMRALQLLETEDPNIVLLDLMLPEADGFELCRQIRERSPVAIIVVSARGGERDKVTALHMGADDYMDRKSTRLN